MKQKRRDSGAARGGPAPPARRGSGFKIGVGLGGLAVVAMVAVYLFGGGGGGGPAPAPAPPDWPEITVDGARLPVYLAATRTARERLLPLQIDPDRALARFFRRYAAPVGVLFVYPDEIFRSVHLDDVRRGGAVTIVFLKTDGGVDSVWPVGNTDFPALPRDRVRYTLFVPGAWADAHPVRESGRIELPPEAVAAAARAEVENPPITDPPPARIRIGGVPLEVEVAARATPRSRGLMFREYLPPGKGMIFLFPKPSEQKFWMRNTRMPLDIAYIGEDYRVRNIVTMTPYDLDRDRKYASAGPVIIALEVPAGWFRKHGVRKGARLEVPESLKARQRNADP